MSKVIIESKKWYQSALQLVRNFDFELVTVYDNIGGKPPKNVTNCQFCGQHLRYVAIISGTPMNATTKTPIKQHIGCDCLERVLGNTWKDYGSAMRQYKTLVEAAKAESRKLKYAEKYAEYIKWIEGVPTFVRTRFLVDMLTILTTGSKEFSKNMEKYLLWHKNNPKFNGQLVVDNYLRHDDDVNKCKLVLALVEEVDGKDIHTKYSSFSFVNSVLNSISRQNGLTPRQMEAINSVYARYNEKKAKKASAKFGMQTQPTAF